MEDLIVDGIIKKMAHQIEMSTAEAPAVNVFRQNENFLGNQFLSRQHSHLELLNKTVAVITVMLVKEILKSTQHGCHTMNIWLVL